MITPACVLQKVVKSYAGPAREIAVLRGVDLEIRRGESVAIIGPSGSGKSTLLNIAGCLDDPSSGSVVLDGNPVGTLDGSGKSMLRNRYLGFVFQLHHLLPQCTVFENVMVPTLAFGGEDASARAEDIIARVGLANRKDHRPAALSGGECLRAAIARALINQPAFLLADEPTGSLDESTSRRIGDLLFDINRAEGTALLLVTHSRELAARADRRLTLHDGVLQE